MGFRQGDQALVLPPISSVTLSSSAGTVTSNTARITTEALTTAHTAAETLVITKAGVKTTDVVLCQIIGGTNTQGVPVLKPVCTANTVTVTLINQAIATNAFNGTIIFDMIIIPTVP